MKHDVYWLKHAYLAASRCACASGRKVGAVSVSEDGRILSMGFNGVPSKQEHPTVCKRKELGLKSGEDPHLCGCVHAEQNLILNHARNGIGCVDATIYCTTQPCLNCCGLIINAGFSRVVYAESYPQDQERFLEMMKNSGISVSQVIVIQ